MSPGGRFNHKLLYWIVWDKLCIPGRAPHTKETLSNFQEWSRVTRHPLVFRGLTDSQRTLGF